MPPEPLAFMYRTSSIQKPQNIGLMQIQSKHANKHVPSTKQFIEKRKVHEIEITSWKARVYGIFTRVGEVSEIERVSAANE